MWTIDVYEYSGEPFGFKKVGVGAFRAPEQEKEGLWDELFIRCPLF